MLYFQFFLKYVKRKKKSADLHPFCETNFKHFLCIWIWVGRNQTSALSMALLQTFTLQWTSPKNKMEQKLIWEQTRQGCLNLRYLLINVSADCICESRYTLYPETVLLCILTRTWIFGEISMWKEFRWSVWIDYSSLSVNSVQLWMPVTDVLISSVWGVSFCLHHF